MSKDDKDDGYWETDEFEDLVARSLIGLYETKIKRQKKAHKAVRFGEDVLKRFRNVGCYFPPGDRIFFTCPPREGEKGTFSFTQEIDVINDGIPNKAVLNMKPQLDNQKKGMYLSGFYIERIPFIPKPFACDISGYPFRISQLLFENTHVWGGGSIIVISKEGLLQSCYQQDWYTDPISKRPIHIKHRPFMEDGRNMNGNDYFSMWGSITIQTYQDRRYLWNVQAYEGPCKATFGVYQEQIKSLFYSRELPQTTTGRKRPILHWVNAHQRRMKSGTEVDIDKYLRGTHEFVMNDTKFRIINPIKGSQGICHG